jgi:signal transduction histidine kinase
LELSNSLVSTLEMEPLLELILEQLAQAIDYAGATVLIAEGDVLQAISHRGRVPRSMVNQVQLSLEQVKTFWSVLLRHEPLIIDDAQAETAQAENYRRATSACPDVATSYVRAWMGIPLLVQERLVGVLSIAHAQPNAYTTRHAALALAIANQAAVAIENARLYQQARRLAALEERQRLARELHDSVSQALYGIGMSASTARALLDRDPEKAAGPLDYAISLAEAGLMEMRALIFELRPDSLEREGLVSALTRQAMALRARHNLEVQADFCQEPVLPFDTKEALYRIAQEALNNVVKHAQASRVALKLENRSGEIILDIQDDGVGFDPQAEYPGHLGLQSMRERATQLGGKLIIESAPGTGTSLRVQIPSSTT